MDIGLNLNILEDLPDSYKLIIVIFLALAGLLRIFKVAISGLNSEHTYGLVGGFLKKIFNLALLIILLAFILYGISRYSVHIEKWFDHKIEQDRVNAQSQRDKDAITVAVTVREAEEAKVAAIKAKQAEAARVAAIKAKQAEEARVAAVKAKQAEAARVAAIKAKQAEEARVAAVKAKQAEEARVAAVKAKQAEEARVAAIKAKQAEAARVAAIKAKQAEEARIAAVKAKERTILMIKSEFKIMEDAKKNYMIEKSANNFIEKDFWLSKINRSIAKVRPYYRNPSKEILEAVPKEKFDAFVAWKATEIYDL